MEVACSVQLKNCNVTIFGAIATVVQVIDAHMHFLSDSELEFYTGYIQPAAQVKFLQKWGVRHVVNRLGRPVVTWDAVNGAEKPRAEPNWAALKKPREPNLAAIRKSS